FCGLRAFGRRRDYRVAGADRGFLETQLRKSEPVFFLVTTFLLFRASSPPHKSVEGGKEFLASLQLRLRALEIVGWAFQLRLQTQRHFKFGNAFARFAGGEQSQT